MEENLNDSLEAKVKMEPVYIPGECSLCLGDGAVKSMLKPYEFDGKDELYMDMLIKCFAIDISSLKLEDMKHQICNDCIVKLRDALRFKEQVEASLKILETVFKVNNENKVASTDITVKDKRDVAHINDTREDVDIDVKQEESDDMDFEENSMDDPLISILDDDSAVTKVVEEDIRENRALRIDGMYEASSFSTSVVNSLSTITDKEIKVMLELGLFPFVMMMNNVIGCAACRKKFHNLDDLKTHMSNHSYVDIKKAYSLGMYSKTQPLYKVSTKLRCKVCMKDVADYEELNDHVKTCISLANTKKKNNLKRLAVRQNNREFKEVHYPQFVCDHCHKTFATENILDQHKRSDITECSDCVCNSIVAGEAYKERAKTPSSEEKLQYLSNIHHEVWEKIYCTVCWRIYNCAVQLKDHIQKVHMKDRKHKCEKCDAAFLKQSRLLRHMISHDKPKHCCKICQKKYTRETSLLYHIRATHDRVDSKGTSRVEEMADVGSDRSFPLMESDHTYCKQSYMPHRLAHSKTVT